MNGLRRIGRLLMPGWALAEQAEAQARQPLSLPTEITLADITLTLRYLEQTDGSRILTFARALSAHDMLFLRRDITREDQVEAWLEDAAHGLTTTVLALHDDEIVGYATVSSDGLSWTRHVRELRVSVAESMRQKRLGRLLIQQAFAIARAEGAIKMIAQMTVDQVAAIAVFKQMGFAPEARLRSQVIDRDGSLHDLQIMSLDVAAFRAKLDALLGATESRTQL